VPVAISELKVPARLLALSIAAALALSGCAGDAESAEPPITPEPVATQTQEPEPEPVYVAAPLNGVSYLEGSNEFLELPAFQGKIDNVGGAIPQFEMNRADIVWVTRVEGGLTRFIAVWHSDLPEAIGPVRSARPTDPAVAASAGGVFVVSDDRFSYLKDLRSVDMYVGREDTELPKKTTYRESTRRAPHNLMYRALDIAREHAAYGPPPQHFEFATGSERPSALVAGEAVNGFTVRYLNATSKWGAGTAAFNFDENGIALATGSANLPAWLRTQDGKVHNDSTGTQHRTRNVIVLENRLDFSIRDRTYGSIPRALLVENSGVAHIFTDGHYLKAKWSKGSLTDVIRYTLDDGQPVKFAPGNTWIEMMDLDTGKLAIDMMTAVAG
jgi:hypothetical protein